MMYTPTPSTRRPRPPGSFNRKRQCPPSSASKSRDLPPLSSGLPRHCSSNNSISTSSSFGSSPLGIKHGSREKLARISASPSDIGDISLDLDICQSLGGSSSSKAKRKSMLSETAENEPSPPPPYGQSLPTIDTIDVSITSSIDLDLRSKHQGGHESQDEETGQKSDRWETDSEGSGSSSEITLSESQLRDKVRLLRLRLRQEKHASRHPAESLHNPESHLLLTPSETISPSSQIPNSSSYSAESRPVYNKRHSAPPRSSAISAPLELRIAQLQDEADERIAELESALSEAREGQEAQRKAAARFRKEADKLQRDLRQADERLTQSQQDISVFHGTPRFDGRKSTARQAMTEVRESKSRDLPDESRLGWGSTSFPQFPTGSVRLKAWRRSAHLLSDTFGESSPAAPQYRQVATERSESMNSPSSTKNDRYGSTSKRTPTFVSPSRISPFRYSSSSRASSSRIRDERLVVSIQDDDHHVYPTRRYRPPTPHAKTVASAEETQDESTSCSESEEVVQYPTLSCRFNSMRNFVSSNLSLTTPDAKNTGRNLGSEMGSEYGADHDRTSSTLRISPSRYMTHSRTALEGAEESDSGSDGLSHTSGYARPIPIEISAALSSLAAALSPDSPYRTTLAGSSKSTVKADSQTSIEGAMPSSWSNHTNVSELTLRSRNQVSTPKRNKLEAMFAPSREGMERGHHVGSARRSRASLTTSRCSSRRGGSVNRPVALAHRRLRSTDWQSGASPRKRVPSPVEEKMVTTMERTNPRDPKTIPGRILHDLFCWVIIFAEYVEWTVILLFCLLVTLKNGPSGTVGYRRRSHDRRYYI